MRWQKVLLAFQASKLRARTRSLIERSKVQPQFIADLADEELWYGLAHSEPAISYCGRFAETNSALQHKSLRRLEPLPSPFSL